MKEGPDINEVANELVTEIDDLRTQLAASRQRVAGLEVALEAWRKIARRALADKAARKQTEDGEHDD